MTSFTDDELRKIYTFLPLNQEPTIKNINNYIRTLQQNLRQEEDEINEEWSKWRQDVNYSQFNQQYRQLWLQLRDLIDDYRRGSAEMVSLHEHNQMIPTNFEEIERYVLNTPHGFFDYTL